MDTSVRLIALGNGDDRLLAKDFDTSGFAALLPDAEINRFVPASHVIFLPVCKSAGEVIVIEENDDPAYSDPQRADRAQLHSDVIDLIASDLGRKSPDKYMNFTKKRGAVHLT